MTEKVPNSLHDDGGPTGFPNVSGSLDDATETIDLSQWLTRDLTVSGSFDTCGANQTAFGRLLNAVPLPAALVDEASYIVFCNEAWGRLSPDYVRFIGESLLSLVSETKQASILMATLDRVSKERRPLVQECRLDFTDRIVWARIYFRSVRLGTERMLLVILQDVTAEKEKLKLLQRIERAKREWERTFDSVSELIAIVDGKFRVLRLNRPMASRIGVSVQKAVGQPCFKLLHGTDEAPSYCPLGRSIAQGYCTTEEYYEKNLEGYFRETTSPINDDAGAIVGWVLSISDISVRRKLEEDLESRANTDDLTSLYNRRHIREIIHRVCEMSKRYGYPVSLCMLDLDNLKDVNDTYGHEVGDQLLRWFASVMRDQLRSSDFAGRYGGDEFAIVFPSTPVKGAALWVDRMQSYLKLHPFRIGSTEIAISFSAGIAPFVRDEMSLDDLIRSSDKSLYSAKFGGRSRIVISSGSDNSA